MIGKKNIVFGFIYLALTASLGGLMIDMYEDYGRIAQEKQVSVGRLEQIKTDGFEEELEPMNAEQIAKANTDGILAINKLNNSEFSIDYIKGGPHAHGNLEALLNIVVGVVLGFIAIASWQKQVISWFFIIGTLLHSGALALERVFNIEWITPIVNSGIGPVMVLLALLMAGIATAIGFKGEVVKD